TQVTLTASPHNAIFSDGCDTTINGSGQLPQCIVTMASSRLVRVNITNPTLTVTKDGNGRGSVSSSDPVFNCGPESTTCAASFPGGTALTLTASPSVGSQFGGWVTTSCDSIDGPVCNVTMNDARAITATFLLDRHQLGVTLTGSGSGYVVSNPVGVNCGPYGPRCFNYYDYGTVVTMSATQILGLCLPAGPVA